MYVARPLILKLAGRFWKHSASFTQGVLPDFLLEHPERTKEWDVVFDARGHFVEPHTKRSFGLGAIEVRNYIRSWHGAIDHDRIGINIDLSYPTCGPINRYQFALFSEKEGFDELLKHSR